MSVKRILVLHGPNLNRLGQREAEHYAAMTLNELDQSLIQYAEKAGVQLDCKQTNSEATLIDYIHQATVDLVDYIIINPAAYTHTSIACRDALLSTRIPFIEVHLSNIFDRESFRHHSYFSDVALGTISGLGANGYLLALNHILSILAK